VFPWIEPGEHGVLTGSGALTLALADLGNSVVWSGASSQTATLPTVASVPDGSGYAFRNAGTAILTLDPAGTELVNGSATLAMAPGASLDVIKVGGAWHAFFGPDISAAYSAWAGTAGGTANAITLSVSPAPAAYVVGQVIRFLIASTNTTTTTVNLNGLGLKTIRRSDGTTDLTVGDMPAGHIAEITYDGSNFRLRPIQHGRIIGEEIAFYGSALPTGVLWCAGQAVSRTTYAALFAVLGTTYGSGDGSTTFNLPDMRGRAGFGRDDMSVGAANRLTNAGSGVTGTTLGATGGSEYLAAHSHTAGASTVSVPTYSGGTIVGAAAFTISPYDDGGSRALPVPTITVNSAGSGASGNIPPALVRNVGIYAGV
jgi:microcystin-dependent protein